MCENTGHALIAARQWIPREHIEDPARSLMMGLPEDLVFRTKGQLAIGLLTEVFADGIALDFVCGDEVYGSCTQLREYLEERGQGYVLRVPPDFHLTLAAGVRLPCKQAAAQLVGGPRHWEVRSAGNGAKGARWYAWAWLATISPRRYLLIRRHLATGELAFHYCYVPEGQPLSLSRLIRAAGLRWPVEESFEFGKGFGLDQSQVRLYTAIARHTVLVMAALAICAITAALLRHRTSTQAPPPVRPDQPPPASPGMIPLTVPETGRLLARPPPPGATAHWLDWRRRHQALSAWYHQRTRLARDIENALAS
jgi:SRSO17 transposase